MSAGFVSALALLAGAAIASARSARAAAAMAWAASVLLAALGAWTAVGHCALDLAIGGWSGFGPAALHVDGLAGVFLALTGVCGAAVSLAYLEHPPRGGVSSLHALILLSMALVIATDQAFLFLLAWEALTLTVCLLAGADREEPGSLLAGYLTGALNKLGGGALLAAFCLLYARTGSFRFADWAAAAAHLGGGVRAAVFVLLLVGFGAKVGMLPLQVPLPLGYASASGASAASLSLAVTAGFYGLWRLVFATIGPPALWWGLLVVMLGAAGALVGILYAIAQEDIKRFLGFSTVEHSGIALIGLGVALVGRAVGEPKLAAAGLVAATLHVIAHALAKTLAFVGADRVARAAQTRELAPLGGLARALPRTAAGFALATLTLAAIPPLGGFVSEWFTFEALLQGFRLESTVGRLVMALGAALLALTAGLALLAFAKLYGAIFLGRARALAPPRAEPRDPGLGMALLAAGVLCLGPIAPWEIRWLGRGLQGVLGFDLGPHALSHPLVLGPVYEHFSVLAPTWLALVLAGYALLAALVVRALLRPRVRRAPAWISGTLPAPAAVQYTPAAYSNPLRVVLRGLYGYRRSVGPRRAASRRRRRRGDPLRRAQPPAPIVVETYVVQPFEHYLYRPLGAGALWLSGRARRLQSGRIGAYLLYMLAVVLAALALIPTIHP